MADRVTEAREIAGRAAEFARSCGQLAREVIARQTGVQFSDASGAERLAELTNLAEGAGFDAVSRDFEAMGDVLAPLMPRHRWQSRIVWPGGRAAR